MNLEKMTGRIETERLVMFPYTADNLALFNRDLPAFEEQFGISYRGEELDYLLTGFLKKLESEIAEDPEHFLFFTEFLIVLKENSHVIGSIDYKSVPRDGVTEVGYGMNPAYTGHGYMTEALKAFLAFGKTLGIRIVRADTRPDNFRSQNVLKRCGFRFLREEGNLWWEKDLRDTRFDAVALGELLIDFTEYGQSGQGNPLWEANPGGAPCNVLAMLSRLGKKTAFIGKVGRDVYGRQLKKTLEEAGIDTAGLTEDSSVPTTLAIVRRTENGDREFSFYRNPGADVMLREEDLSLSLLQDCRLFHFGTLSMTHPGVRAATQKAVRLAREAGALISFDPNLRFPLWSSEEEARAAAEWGLGACDIAKIADNELLFVSGEADPDRGAAVLRKRFPNIRLLTVTSGAEGSCAYREEISVFEPAYLLGGTVDTTGAGDVFCAAVLKDVLENGLDGRKEEDLRAMLRIANAAAYLVTTKKGVIRSVPDPQQIRAVLETGPRG